MQKNEDEAKSLDELISKYKELKESENLDVDGRKEIKKIQNDIADLVGVQASNAWWKGRLWRPLLTYLKSCRIYKTRAGSSNLVLPAQSLS